MRAIRSSLPRESPTRPVEAEHPWIRALEIFGVSFACYGADGSRRYEFSGVPVDANECEAWNGLLQQADRVVAEELDGTRPHLHVGRLALVREIPATVGGAVLAVYAARGGDFGAVIVVRPKLTQRVSGFAMYGLTPRESAVAQLIALGLSTKEIASRLGISSHTVCRHTERVFAKLGVRNRAGVGALSRSHPTTAC